tara:strand:+ start:1068 stop:1415 length:348 start_codon:yes stop_codon:yes gene_type:complete
MVILSTTTDAQTIKVIPREYVTSATMKLRDDTTNTEVSYSVSPTTDKNYLQISQALSLKEGRYYDLTILDGTSVIYKDKIFCTAQTVDQSSNDYYTINDSVYTTDTSFDNDYIVL